MSTFGVEFLSNKNLAVALADYKDKIPRMQWRLHEVLFVTAYDSFTLSQKSVFNTKSSDLDAKLKDAMPLQVLLDPGYAKNLQVKIERLKAKQQAVIDEVAKRKLTGEPKGVHHTIFYMDRLNKSGDLAGTWTFTQTSAAVAGVGGNAQTLGLGAGDYVKAAAIDEWYKISAVGGENAITLAYNFVAATQAGVVASYADVSVNDGTTTGKAFVHPNQFTTDLLRTAGDIVYVRRNQTHLIMAVVVNFDEDGTKALPMEFVGDDGTGWAGDADVKPTFNFGTSSFNFNTSGDDYWNFRRIIINGGSNVQGVFIVGGNFDWFYDCATQNCTGGGYGVTFLWNGQNYYFENCAWTGNSNNAVNQYQGSYAKFVNCTWNGNSNCLANGATGAVADLIGCSFGTSSANTGYNIYCGTNAKAYARNCVFEAGATKIQAAGAKSGVYSEDHNSVKGDHKAWFYEGTIIKDTVTVRVGGASSSAKVAPSTTIATYPYLFTIFEACMYAPAVAKTYSLYMLGNAWTTLPTAGQLYTEVEYFDEAGTAHKTTSVSTAVLAVNDLWYEFPVTVHPAADGLLRIRAYLTKYQAGAYVYVDIKPVVS